MNLLSSRKTHKLVLTHTGPELLRALFGILGRLEDESTVARFETEFAKSLGLEEAVVCPHARIAVQALLKGYDFEVGTEVLMTPLTIADMVNSIHSAGLRPVFVDIETRNFNFDLEQLEKAITPRTRAILITYLAGVVPDLEAILEIARRHGLKVIEDCSQAYGASYAGRPAGTWGDVAVFSLTNFKMVSALFGGMVISRDPATLKRLREFLKRETLPTRRKLLFRHCLKNLVYSVLFSRWVFSYATYFLVLLLEYLDPQITYRLYSGNIRVVSGEPNHRLLSQFPPHYFERFTVPQARLGLASLRRARAESGK